MMKLLEKENLNDVQAKMKLITSQNVRGVE